MKNKTTDELGVFAEIESAFIAASESLIDARNLLKQSPTRFTNEQSRLLSSRVAEVLERLDEATRAAQSRFS